VLFCVLCGQIVEFSNGRAGSSYIYHFAFKDKQDGWLGSQVHIWRVSFKEDCWVLGICEDY